LRDYEVLYIVRADLDDEKVQDAVKRVNQDFQFDPGRVPELESALKITEEVLRHLIVRKPEKAAVATTVAPPPAEVVLEPIAAESEPVGEPAASANGKES
jgi:ribosomal protein S6